MNEDMSHGIVDRAVCETVWKLMNQSSCTRPCRHHLWTVDPNLPLFFRRMRGQISSCLLQAAWVLLFSKVWLVTEESNRTYSQILQDPMHCYPHEFSCSWFVWVAYDSFVPKPRTSPQPFSSPSPCCLDAGKVN